MLLPRTRVSEPAQNPAGHDLCDDRNEETARLGPQEQEDPYLSLSSNKISPKLFCKVNVTYPINYTVLFSINPLVHSASTQVTSTSRGQWLAATRLESTECISNITESSAGQHQNQESPFTQVSTRDQETSALLKPTVWGKQPLINKQHQQLSI